MRRLEPVIRYMILDFFVPFLILFFVVSEIDKARVDTLHTKFKVRIKQKVSFNVSSFTEIFMKLEAVCLFTFC
jgi:hypothetical protein